LDISCHPGDQSFLILWPSCLIHPQVRTVWEPLQTACVITNFETCKNSLITLFTADVVLLLVMLVGLLRLRRSGGGTFDLGRLLWKQV
jgi:hypothetical protein